MTLSYHRFFDESAHFQQFVVRSYSNLNVSHFCNFSLSRKSLIFPIHPSTDVEYQLVNRMPEHISKSDSTPAMSVGLIYSRGNDVLQERSKLIPLNPQNSLSVFGCTVILNCASLYSRQRSVVGRSRLSKLTVIK